MAEETMIMDQAIDNEVEVTELEPTGSSESVLTKAIVNGLKFAGKVTIGAGIATVVGHYVGKACNKADEKARIRKAAREAAAAEKEKIAKEKEAEAKKSDVETSDEGQKVLDETAEE